MNSAFALSSTTFLYGLAMVCYVGAFAFKNKTLATAGFYVLAAGFLANTAGIGLRWVESYQMGIGRAPFSNMYESLVFFSWTMAALYLYVEMTSFDPGISAKINPLIPALKSNWLIAHVVTCFLGYAGFALAFGLSLTYFVKPKQPEKSVIFSRLPDEEIIDELTYQMVVFGFLFLTIGIITGAVWANSAWGKYWSWDPKETWSLITWFVYAIFLHLRMMRGWHGRNLALVSIIGFMAVLFTYFGVNFLLSGLHSYG
jgi:ABC-type transport system involved in cytochrome c biogenesis permease subunit